MDLPPSSFAGNFADHSCSPVDVNSLQVPSTIKEQNEGCPRILEEKVSLPVRERRAKLVPVIM